MARLQWFAGVTGCAISVLALAQPSSMGPLAPPANGPRRADSTWTALVDCTLHTTPQTTLDHATVVFRDGFITSVLSAERTDEAHAMGHDAKGPIRAAAAPAGAHVIDCKGLHVYPGFIDAYVEVDAPAPAGEPSSLHWNKKVTPQRSALDGAGIDERTAESLRKLGFTTACISPKGGVFRGTSAVVSLAKPVEEASAARPPVYRDKAYQSVAFELGGGYPGSEMGAIALMRQTFIDADWQASARQAGQVIPANCLDALEVAPGHKASVINSVISPWLAMSSLDLFTFPYSFTAPTSSGQVGWNLDPMRRLDMASWTLDAGIWIHMSDCEPESGTRYAGVERVNLGAFSSVPKSFFLFNTDDALECLRVAKVAKEFGRDGAILGSGNEFTRLEAIKADGLPFIVPLTFPKAPDVSSVGKAEGVEVKELMTWEQAPTNPRRMAKAGITFSLTTAKLKDRNDFARNLKTAIKHGLTEEQALAALTTSPAEMLGVSNQVGSIEEGKRANMILADGPIFGDKTKIRAVYVDGQTHELNPAPGNVEGTWKLEVPSASEGDRKIVIDKDNGITVWLNDKSVKASKTAVEKDHLSFVFEHEPLDGKAGVFVASAIIERDAGGTPTRIEGQCMPPNGESFAWRGTRQPASLEGLWPIMVSSDATKGGSVGGGGSTNVGVISIDKDTKITMWDNPKGENGEPITFDNIVYEGNSLSYGFGGNTINATVDFTQMPPVLSGTVKGPQTNVVWKAARHAPNPFSGTWRMTSHDDIPIEPGSKDETTMVIGEKTVTTTLPKAPGGPVVVKSDDVKTGLTEKPPTNKITFSQDLTKLGVEGKGETTATIAFATDGTAKDTLTGKTTFPDGSSHSFKAVRQVEEPITVATGLTMDQAEADRIKAIPEELPLPFGPYGYSQLPAKANTVLTHATIWTSGPQGVLKDATLVIRDGRIAAVSKVSTSHDQDGAGTVVIDCTGKSITPGIIDCHSHTGISRGVNEGGQAVTSEVRIADVTDPDDVNWYRQLAGGVTTVNSLHGSANAIGGQSQTNKLRWGCAAADDMHFEGAKPGIKFALGENPRQVNGGGRGGSGRYPQSRMGVETLIRDRFTAAREYLAARDEETKRRSVSAAPSPSQIDAKAKGSPSLSLSVSSSLPPRRDLELEALAEVLKGDRIVHCHSYRQDEVVMLCNIAKEFGFKIGTFQHILEGYKVADYVRDYTTGGGSGFADWWAYKVEVQDAIPQAFPIMHDVGVLVSYNSDSNELARRLNVEAGKAVKYGGTSPEESLKFVTINPAKQLQIDKWVGSLEVGKDADLAIWSGDPMSSLSKCEATYVDGRCLFSLEQDAAHRKIIAGERQRLIQKILAEPKGKKDAEGDKGDKPEGGPRPDGGGGGGGGGRRRRPPQDDAGALFSYYMDLFTSGKGANETPGECGDE